MNKASLVALLAVCVASVAHAESTGIVGRSGKQGTYCAECHGNSGVFSTMVTLSGPTVVQPSSVNTYTVTITASTAAGAAAAGFNAAASAGVITTTDPGAQIVPNAGVDEVTHAFPPKPFVAGVVQFTFRWEAPAQPASGAPYTLYAAGNAVNLSGSEVGDDPELAVPLVVTVSCVDDDFDGYCSDNCVGSACDNCPTAYNPSQSDCDLDGQGDVCDVDCAGSVCAGKCLGTCGNGFVDAGEDCDDGTETAACDADCSIPVCGDGVVNALVGEACDDRGASPDCNADCSLPVCGDGILNPSAGEACETTSDTADCDADCTRPFCGDGHANAAAGETCDSAGPSATCDADCTAVECGDGVVNATAGEACDDGNVTGGDGCSADCTVRANGWDCSTPGAPCVEICGDLIRVGSEQCDDGGPSMQCTDRCTVSSCGDGIVNIAVPEACDEGSAPASGGCSGDCSTQFPGWHCTPGQSCTTLCGDGTAAGVEQCDHGGESATCDADCTLVMCGDGMLNAAALEACDDGNQLAGDGCNDACEVELGWHCPVPGAPCATTCGDSIAAGSEACDHGASNSDTIPDACRTDCTMARCGDGVIDTDEACDAGALNDDDAPNRCRTSCELPACGDGVVDRAYLESCDDGNLTPGDGCSATCVLETCGNAVVDPQEECDDGLYNSDVVSGACRTSCIAAFCGDGVIDAGESCDDGTYNSNLLANFCRSDCKLPSCGDGVVDAGEECEPSAEDCTAECRKVEEVTASGCRGSGASGLSIVLCVLALRRRRRPARLSLH